MKIELTIGASEAVAEERVSMGILAGADQECVVVEVVVIDEGFVWR